MKGINNEHFGVMKIEEQVAIMIMNIDNKPIKFPIKFPICPGPNIPGSGIPGILPICMETPAGIPGPPGNDAN